MKRRSFIKAGVAGAGLVGAGIAAEAQEQRGRPTRGPRREYYEWRTYRIKDEGQQAQVEAYLEKAFIPAANRLGVAKVGVFTEMEASDTRRLHVLLVHRSLRSALGLTRQLMADEAHVTAGAAYLDTPPGAPAYERIQSSIMAAFEGMPQAKIPEQKPRIFELRQYESHNETKARKKIEMFDKSEIQLFLKTGLIPVFFGEMLVGENIPNLTYMLVFDDMADHDSDWKSFVESPEWKELSAREEYKDTVSHITKTFLVPTAYSQI